MSVKKKALNLYSLEISLYKRQSTLKPPDEDDCIQSFTKRSDILSNC